MKDQHFEETILLLQELNKEFPSYSLGRNISTALSEYGDVWGMSNKEFLFALTKYKAELSLDSPHIETDIDDIIKGGMNLFENVHEEEEEEY